MLALFFTASSTNAQTQPEKHSIGGMPNPADLYCEFMGREIWRYKDKTGHSSDCLFDDFTYCDTWAYFNGSCGQEHSICAYMGLDTVFLPRGRYSEYELHCAYENTIIDSVANMIDISSNCLGNIGMTEQLETNKKGPDIPDITLETDFSWRNHNGHDWMTPVKNQGSCGSCWAFGPVGAIEAVYKIQSNNPTWDPNFSEEYLISDCFPAVEWSRNDCCHGSGALTLQHIKEVGLPFEECMPTDEATYTDLSNPCKCTGGNTCDPACPNGPDSCALSNCADDLCDDTHPFSGRITINDYFQVGDDPNLTREENLLQMKQALVQFGPLSVFYLHSGYIDSSGVFRCDGHEDVCWDLNENGICDLGVCDSGVCTEGLADKVGDPCSAHEECGEDKNGDGVCDYKDCINKVFCWDINQDGDCQLTGVCTNNVCSEGLVGEACEENINCSEDKNGDGKCDYKDCSSNHFVSISGYSDTHGAWEIKNSWGTSTGTGSNGYFYLAYDDCHIEKRAYYILPESDQEFTHTFWDENASDWSLLNGQSTMLENTTHFTKGTASMEADGFGFRTYESTPISTDFLTVATSLFMDLFIGSQQTNPNWIGQIQLYVNSPSAGIYNEFQEHIDLTGLPQDEFTELQFNLSYVVQQALLGSYDDFSIRIAFNTNWGSGPFLIDNIEFL